MYTVYRVEHHHRVNSESRHPEGPFQGDYLGNNGIDAYREHMDPLSDDPAEHPTPTNDNITNLDNNFVFGTLELDDLLTWFPCEDGRLGMQNMDYVIRIYKTRILPEHFGSYQVAFDADTAIEFATMDIVTTEIYDYTELRTG